MARTLDGKVAVATGAGRGIGRANPLAVARASATVVANECCPATDGTSRAVSPARAVFSAIVAKRGQAKPDSTDGSDWGAAQPIGDAAISAFDSADTQFIDAAISRFRGAIAQISYEDFTRTGS